jgi:hypothetical protein
MLALHEEAAERLEREEAMRQATASYERLAREDPEAFAAYRAEGTLWDTTSGDGLGSAGAEFPEFNS